MNINLLHHNKNLDLESSGIIPVTFVAPCANFLPVRLLQQVQCQGGLSKVIVCPGNCGFCIAH